MDSLKTQEMNSFLFYIAILFLFPKSLTDAQSESRKNLLGKENVSRSVVQQKLTETFRIVVNEQNTDNRTLEVNGTGIPGAKVYVFLYPGRITGEENKGGRIKEDQELSTVVNASGKWNVSLKLFETSAKSSMVISAYQTLGNYSSEIVRKIIRNKS